MKRMRPSVETMGDSDAIAVERTLAGDRDAFRVLVERHSRNVFRLAYRMTGKQIYAQHAAEILKLYADKYKEYPIVDNYGKQSDWGARVYSQTLNESIWLIDMTFAYDLVRGSGENAVEMSVIAA